MFKKVCINVMLAYITDSDNIITIMEQIIFSEKHKGYIKKKFDDSLKKVAKHYKKIYDLDRAFSENDFILLTHYYFVNSVKNSIPIFKILSSMTSEFLSSQKSKGKKKIDLGVIEMRRKWWPILAAEFKYESSGGVDLSRLCKRFKNDFEKIKEEGTCKKYFILIHRPNNPNHPDSDKENKRKQINSLKSNLKKKDYKNFYLFYMTPEYHIFEKLK